MSSFGENIDETSGGMKSKGLDQTFEDLPSLQVKERKVSKQSPSQTALYYHDKYS